MSGHARLPASAAHRWTACPASAYMDEEGDRRGSRYAAEGTAAHFLVEQCLNEGFNPRKFIDLTVSVDENGMAYLGLPVDDDWGFPVDPDMIDAARTFLQCAQDAVLTMPVAGGVTYVEERVSPGHPELGGTLDWAHVAGRYAAIADLKYGRGVVVDVQDNPQQMIYALGLLERHPEVEFVESFIVQPRAPHADGPVRSCVYTVDELSSFYIWLLERVDATKEPGSPRIAGDHCRFCPDLANCPAALEAAQGAAATEFTDSDPGNHVAAALALAPMVESWAKAVRAAALARLMDERDVPGWKLVHGRGSREWNISEGDVVKLARRAGLLKKHCFKPASLLSPYGMEQASTKRVDWTGKEAAAHFSALVDKVPGGPTIAPEDDPRGPYRGAPEDDFDVQ